jgi:hypothetical protein
MDTPQIVCCLRDVGSFLGVFPFDLLRKYPIARSGTLIVNIDRLTESGSHWFVIHLQPRSSTAYYFDSYGLPPFISSIQSFMNRKCTVGNYNSLQLQGPTTAVCGKYCCTFASYKNKGYSPQHFVGLIATVDTEKRVSEMFRAEFGLLPKMGRSEGQCSVGVRLVFSNTSPRYVCLFLIQTLTLNIRLFSVL